VTIAASLTVSPAPFWVALDQGFFQAVGLDATGRDSARSGPWPQAPPA